LKPTLSLLYATALLCYTELNAQISRTDSLTQLIEQSTELSQKAGWLLQRSQFWPGTELERPMADARQALAYYQQTGNEKGQVEAYLQTALVYTRQNNYQVAIELDSQALQIANKINDKRNAAKALNYLGRSFTVIGKPDLAEQNCLQALQLQQDLGLERDMADVHNNLGIIYRKKSDIDKSLDQFDKGIAVAKKFNLAVLLGNLYMNKANSLNEMARYDEAIGMHMESIHVKEKIKDERGLMQSYNNIALVFKQVREYAKSLEYMRKANRLAQQFNNRTTLGFSYANMATLLIQMRQKDSVPWLFEQALAVFKQMGERSGQALVYHNYGNYLMEETKQYDRSEEMLKQALEIRRGLKAKYDIASTMNLLGSLLTRKGKLKEAEDYLLQSLDLLRDENSYRKRDAYSYLAVYYKAAGDFEDAYKYQAAYLAMRDTLVSEQEIVTILKRQQHY
jgi:tetratricopeptide (TPR) repeat protein